MAGTSQAGSGPPVIAGWRSRAAHWLALRLESGARVLKRLALSWAQDAAVAAPNATEGDSPRASRDLAAPHASDVAARGRPPAHWLEYIRARSPALYDAIRARESKTVAPAAYDSARAGVPSEMSRAARNQREEPEPREMPLPPAERLDRKAWPPPKDSGPQDWETLAEEGLQENQLDASPAARREPEPSPRRLFGAPKHVAAYADGRADEQGLEGLDQTPLVGQDEPPATDALVAKTSHSPATVGVRRWERPIHRLFLRPARSFRPTPDVSPVSTIKADGMIDIFEPSQPDSSVLPDGDAPITRASAPDAPDRETTQALASRSRMGQAPLIVAPRFHTAQHAPIHDMGNWPATISSSIPSLEERLPEPTPEQHAQEPSSAPARWPNSARPISPPTASAEPGAMLAAPWSGGGRRPEPTSGSPAEPPSDPWPPLADPLASSSDSAEIARRLARQADERRSRLDREQKGLLWNE